MIIINPEFKNIIPPLEKEEFSQLEKNILSYGCRDPLTLWGNTLIDGHNRHEICSRLNIPFKTVSLNFDCVEDVVVWMIDNQEGRRNLNNFVRTELQLRKKSAIAAKAKANKVEAGKNYGERHSKQEVCQISDKPLVPIDTKKEIAKAANVSHDTVHKVDTILKMAEPEIVQAVRDNRISINLASQLADLPKEEQRVVANKPPEEIKEVAREVLKQAHVSNNTGNNEWYTPAKYIEMAMAVMGSIDTDPATSVIANKTVKATKIFTAEDNGLAQKWSGNVWMNPPYAQPLISQFSEAIANKFVSGEISQGIVLVNNATETAWFQILLAQASAVCFPKSRVRFVAPDGSLGAPLQGQAIVYFGSNAALFGEVFGKEGTVLYHG